MIEGVKFPKYHKIQSVFKRDPKTNFRTFLMGDWTTPEFQLLRKSEWIFTEKIDGTNIRIQWVAPEIVPWVDSRFGGMTIGGRTDRAEIPRTLNESIHAEIGGPDKFSEVFRREEGEAVTVPITLFGEGYGEKIQKGGGDYLVGRCGFILFDVLVGNTWLKREDVEDVASKFGVPVVPIIGSGTLIDMVEAALGGIDSRIAERKRWAEGIVARPGVELRDRMGRRIITKVKLKDFPE